VLAALVLSVAACHSASGSDPLTPAGTPPVAAPQAGADLPEDVAATVDATVITVAALDERVRAAAADPQVAAGLADGDGQERLRQLQASLLTQEILTSVIVDGAEELGVGVRDEDVAAVRRDLVARAGGEQQFLEAAEQAHLPPSLVDEQLRSLAALRNLERKLAPDAAAETPALVTPPAGPGTAESTPSASQLAVQEYIGRRLAAARVVVNDAYGHWDPSTGVVVDSGGAPGPAPSETEQR
jgi:hypothetical protein